jgi:hypothetical protein
MWLWAMGSCREIGGGRLSSLTKSARVGLKSPTSLKISRFKNVCQIFWLSAGDWPSDVFVCCVHGNPFNFGCAIKKSDSLYYSGYWVKVLVVFCKNPAIFLKNR